MNLSVLVKKAKSMKISYELTAQELKVRFANSTEFSIALDSDYYAFHLFFKMLDQYIEVL